MARPVVTAEGCRLAVLAALALAGPVARGDAPFVDVPSLWQPLAADAPRLPATAWAAPPVGTAAPPHRVRLFCIQPGFLCDTPGLETDDPTSAPAADDGDLDWLNVSAGNDNPFLDLRRAGDPGGVGYTRVNTQVQLFDTARTACSLGLQAVTPAGLQFDGLPDHLGPTVVTPALSLYHALDEGTAIQAFVGKNLPLMNHAARPVRRALQYGVAVQQPLGDDPTDLFSGLYLSFGALGTMRRETEGTDRRLTPVWEMLPGLHYQMADNWWVSSAVVLPVGPVRPDRQHWQVTCSLQF